MLDARKRLPLGGARLDRLRYRLAEVVLVTMTASAVLVTIVCCTRFVLQAVGVVDQSLFEDPAPGLWTLASGALLRHLYLHVLPKRLDGDGPP